MPFKHRLKQLKFAKATIVLLSKKKKFEASLILNLAHLEMDDHKLNITNKNKKKCKFET